VSCTERVLCVHINISMNKNINMRTKKINLTALVDTMCLGSQAAITNGSLV
jgi:hypothetical protein